MDLELWSCLCIINPLVGWEAEAQRLDIYLALRYEQQQAVAEAEEIMSGNLRD